MTVGAVIFYYDCMTTTHSVPETLELDNDLLDTVTGGTGGTVLVPTEECPTCVSGVDPTVLSSQHQNLLAGDL
ncbi:hypothetical protein ATI61_106648 [Archangium gephyra]|uniref:Uncharacterized protein n=2 Tax=Archangium gephyra TaxID=48 RepID=A0ABX9K194_9BACT|nr:hypothetical protein ATI61_106648 [Archangium gephyra]